MVYTPAQVVLASLLGSPLAGGFLLFRNARNHRLGHSFFQLLMGLAVFAFFLGCWLYLPNPAGWVAFVGGAFLMGFMGRAQGLSGPAVSWVWPFGIGVIFCVPVVLLSIGLVLVKVALDAPVDTDVGPRCNVARYPGVTVAEARALAEGLKKEGYFNGLDDRSVDLLHEKGVYRVRIWPGNEGWEDSEVIGRFTDLARVLSKENFGGKRVVIDLMDHQGDLRRTVP